MILSNMRLKKYFNRQFLKLYLIDLIFFILTSGFIFLALFKISKYANFLKNFQPEQSLVQGYDIDPNVLNTYLTIASPIANKIMLFFYLTPIIILIAYILMQGLSWSRIKETRYKSFIARFLAVTLIFGLIILLAVIANLGIFSDVIIFIALYFMLLSYTLIKKNVLKDLKKAFVMGLKKFYPLFLIYLLWILASLIILFIYTLAEGFFSLPITIIALLVLIGLFVLFKRVLYDFIKKYD